MEDNETFEHINQWSGSSVLPSIPNEEIIGSVRKQLSGTLVKQKLEADQGTFTQDWKKEAELQHAKQKAGLQTKDVPKDEQEFSNSAELPPGLINDLLSLREDYPEEDDIDLGTKVLSQSQHDNSSNHPQPWVKTFAKDTAKFNKFYAADLNAYEGVQFPDDVEDLDETSVSVNNFVDFSIVKEKSIRGCKNLPLEIGTEFSIKPSFTEGCSLLSGRSTSMNKSNASFAKSSASIHKGNASFSESSAFYDKGSASIDKGIISIANDSASIANGSAPFANGSAMLANGSASFANGSAMLANGSASFANGSAMLANGSASIANGSASFANGSASFANGSAMLANGSASIADGSASFANGSAMLANGSASIYKDSASIDKGKFANGNAGDLEGPSEKAVNTILENYFESKGKLLRPLDLQGTSGYTGISATVSVSELLQAAQYHGCANKILLLPIHDPPNTNEPPRPSNSAQMGETFGVLKLAEPDGLGNPAKQGYGFDTPFTTSQTSSCTTNQPNVQMTHTQPLRNASGHFLSTVNQSRATQFQTGVSVPMSSNLSMPDSANASPRANQNISAQSNLNLVAHPEPPDLTHYTCSDELKRALQLKFLPFRSGQLGQNFQSNGTAYGQRQHPYTRPEASSTGEIQTSLPNLPEFMKNLFE